mmetsp:Transcript_17955/g.16234  ORF Transcript_17955/g.16234 Transcript_17955/m.16234 type:complete len:494 (-) Transcript_17955:46-1527(-)
MENENNDNIPYNDRIISKVDYQSCYNTINLINEGTQENDYDDDNNDNNDSNIYKGVCQLNDDDDNNDKERIVKRRMVDEKFRQNIITIERVIYPIFNEYISKLSLKDNNIILDIQRNHPNAFLADLCSIIGDYYKHKGTYFYNLIENQISNNNNKQRIDDFKTLYPEDKDIVEYIQLKYSNDNFEDLCYKLSDALKNSTMIHAEFFYNLAAYGDSIYTRNDCYGSLGWIFLTEFNSEIAWNNPSKPTASLLHNINQAQLAFSQSYGEVSFYLVVELRDKAYELATWYINSRELDNTLSTLFNSTVFKLNVLNFFESIIGLLKAGTYGVKEDDSDLLHLLIKNRFIGFKQYDKSYGFHHIWYGYGFIVRAKGFYKSSKNAEYTVGIVSKDPINNDEDGNPKSLVTDNKRMLIFTPDNEVFKIASCKGRIIYFIIPSRHNNLWYKPNEDNMMNYAHFRLKAFNLNKSEMHLHTVNRNYVINSPRPLQAVVRKQSR